MGKAGAYLNRAKQGVKEAVESRGSVVVFVVLTLLLIVVIIAYIVWRLKSSDLHAVKVLTTPRRLQGNKAFTFPSSKLPAMTVGQQFSLSFWLYLTDFQPTSLPKLLVMRQPSTTNGSTNSLANANPIVFMDQTLNQLYICVGTTRTPPSTKTTLGQVISTSGKGNANSWTYLFATVQYVPLQRWVNYTVTVQDNLLTVFADGSIYTVQSLYDMVDTTSTTPRPMFAACSGDIKVGNTSSTLSGDANGFVGNVLFFNYALGIEQVRSVYGQGPNAGNGWLSKLGVPDYGVRSPIYVVGSEDDDGDSE